MLRVQKIQKKVNPQKSSGYIEYIVKGEDNIRTLDIKDMTKDSPLFNFMIENEPEDNYKEINENLFIKLIEKNVTYGYDIENIYLKKTYENNNLIKNNYISENKLNYLFTYYPEQKNMLNNLSHELFLFAKKYICYFDYELQELFDKFVNIMNKYIVSKLNCEDYKYSICCVPSHEKSDRNYNTMTEVIKSLKVRYKDKYFEDGSNFITRKNTITKSSYNMEPRTVEKQLESLEIRNPELVKDKTILLIDDFYTSGSSMNACKKLLLENGAKQVILFAFAKTRDKNKGMMD